MNKLKDSNEIVKVFIKVGDCYILSRKKDKGSESDGLLEHIGGHIEFGESPFTALLRETKEEEETGLLSRELEQSRPIPKEIFVNANGRIEKHYIYHMTISEEIAMHLRISNEESYGFEFLESSLIESEEGLSKIQKKLTWKTKAIFRAMGINI